MTNIAAAPATSKVLPRAAIPPAIGTVGSVGWKALDLALNVDFLLSLEDVQMANVFQFVLDYGWLGIFVPCVLWWVFAAKHVSDTNWPGTLAASIAMSAIVFFGVGAIATSSVIGGSPKVIISYGTRDAPPACWADLNTSRLLNLAERYSLVMICGPFDTSIDHMADDRVVISNPFVITGKNTPISVNLTQEYLDSIASYRFLWIRTAVIPKDVKVAQVNSLLSIQNVGGQIFDDWQMTNRY